MGILAGRSDMRVFNILVGTARKENLIRTSGLVLSIFSIFSPLVRRGTRSFVAAGAIKVWF